MKRTVKYCMENPWRCPSCGNRFPSKLKFEKHKNEKEICHLAYLEGLVAVEVLVMMGNDRPLKDWEYALPINVFKRM